MKDILIAIDPGELTGLVIVNKVTAEVHRSAELTEFEVTKLVEEFLYLNPATEVVMEKFTINPDTHKKSAQPTALYLIGAVRHLYMKYTGKVVPLQTPGDAKSFSTNDKLKAVGFWHKGGEGHANDAFRHALLYMVRTDRDFGTTLLNKIETK